jgi:hypothetical protein
MAKIKFTLKGVTNEIRKSSLPGRRDGDRAVRTMVHDEIVVHEMGGRCPFSPNSSLDLSPHA